MFAWMLDRYWRWKHGREWALGKPWERVPRTLGLYPAYSDWVGGFAVDQAGEIWFSDEPAIWKDPHRVAEPDIRFAVIGVAVRRHPELAQFMPVRGPDDRICPTCFGVGYPKQLPPKLRYRILCQCGGLGWIPRATLGAQGGNHLESVPPVA